MTKVELSHIDFISFYQILVYEYNGYFMEENSYNRYDWMVLLNTSAKLQFQHIFNHCELQLKKYITEKTINEINKFSIVNIT